MNQSTQSVRMYGSISDNQHALQVHIANKVPHWKVYGDGNALIEFRLGGIPGGGNQWLSIDTTESGDKASKRTMVTLNESSARALYEHLHAAFKASA